MTKVEKLLQEVAVYFKGKLLKGEFEFVKCGNHVAKVLVDGKYEIHVWIANNPEKDLFIYKIDDIFGDALSFDGNNEKSIVWNHIEPMVIQYRKEELNKLKEEQIALLQEQLKQ